MTETIHTPWQDVTLKAALAALGMADAVTGQAGEPVTAILGRPAGDTPLVVVTREELADMLEDAAATAAYHASRDEETFPSSVVDRVLAGENPIRVYREHRGQTLTDLAKTIGIPKGYLSEIETGKKTGPADLLKRIAEALGVDLDDIVR
ncbi:MAG: helix-turn-helix domain-containing protein [Alphaproteobacteria bacterium]